MFVSSVLLTVDKIFLTFILNFLAYAFTLGLLFTSLSLGQTRQFRSLSTISRLTLTAFTKFTLLLGLLSLSGIPPLAGFFAKFFIFFALVLKGNLVLVLVFLFFNLFALYFYLQITRHLSSTATQKSLKLTFTRATLANETSSS